MIYMLAWYWVWTGNDWECGYMYGHGTDTVIKVGNTNYIVANLNPLHLKYIMKPNDPVKSNDVNIASFSW